MHKEEADPDESSTKRFFRGTLPSWFSAICLLVLGFMGQRMIVEFDAFKNRVAETVTRVTVLEIQLKALDSNMGEIRMGQKDVIGELRSIGIQLKTNAGK